VAWSLLEWSSCGVFRDEVTGPLSLAICRRQEDRGHVCALSQALPICDSLTGALGPALCGPIPSGYKCTLSCGYHYYLHALVSQSTMLPEPEYSPVAILLPRFWDAISILTSKKMARNDRIQADLLPSLAIISSTREALCGLVESTAFVRTFSRPGNLLDSAHGSIWSFDSITGIGSDSVRETRSVHCPYLRAPKHKASASSQVNWTSALVMSLPRSDGLAQQASLGRPRLELSKNTQKDCVICSVPKSCALVVSLRKSDPTYIEGFAHTTVPLLTV